MGRAIWSDLWQGSRELTDFPALRCGDHTLSFEEFRTQILRAEAGLRALGVKEGDLVTLITLNTPEAVIAFYAIDRIGAVANLVDVKLSPSEVEGYLRNAASRVVLVLELAFQKVYQNRGKAPAEHFVVLPLKRYLPEQLGEKLGLDTWQKSAGRDCCRWESLLMDPDEKIPPNETRWEEGAAITYTGGTTGPAKGVLLSRRALCASLDQYRDSGTEEGSGKANLTLLPIFAAFGLCQTIHVPLCLGMTVILAPLFRPHQLGQLLLRYRPEQVSGTTAYWRLLLQSEDVQDADLSFLTNPRCGGDALSYGMEERIHSFLSAHGCHAPLVKEYGMTEVCGIMCVSDGKPVKLGTAGKPLKGSRILAVDPDTGEALPPDREGELVIHSPTVMNGYYNLPRSDSEVLRPGPEGKLWVWTKDIGTVAADGTVTVTGRKKRMISRNGFKIFPNVIEDCILQSPLVVSCAVVGAEKRGETFPVAHVVLARGADPEESEKILRSHCRGALNDYLIPAAYRFCQSLPLTERGKLDYRSLERMGFPKN